MNEAWFVWESVDEREYKMHLALASAREKGKAAAQIHWDRHKDAMGVPHEPLAWNDLPDCSYAFKPDTHEDEGYFVDRYDFDVMYVFNPACLDDDEADEEIAVTL